MVVLSLYLSMLQYQRPQLIFCYLGIYVVVSLLVSADSCFFLPINNFNLIYICRLAVKEIGAKCLNSIMDELIYKLSVENSDILGM